MIWIISKECACTLYVIPPIEPGVPWAMGYQYNNQMPPPLPQRRKVFITFIGIILKENPFVFPLKSSSYLMKYTFSCCISALLFSVFPQSKICFHFYAFEGDLYLQICWIKHCNVDTPQNKLLFLLTIFCLYFFF